MSDSHPGPPPKPKPGSLRDRIAAFERPAQSAQPPGPPLPRPKPAAVQWRPRQQQQPDDGDGHDQNTGSGAEGASSSSISGNTRAGAGTTTTTNNNNNNNNSMSASDARESIRQGGSLKDRMAALQGRGAFGGGAAPSPSPPPPSAPPLVQKPKWKPPPPPVVVPAEGEERVVSTGDVEDRAGQVDVVVDVGDEHENRGQEEGKEKEEEQGQAQAQGDQPDPEEDERQRRAAIAARMAKLGGARVGMGPPIFGGAKAPPPRVAKKPETLRSPTTSEAEVPSSPPPPPPPAAAEEASAETERGVGLDATPAHSRSPPPSMPAPAVPRRTAPPRRKPPKSPAQPEVTESELTTQVTAEHLDVLGDAGPLAKEERREVEVQPVEEVETMQCLVEEEETKAHDAAPVHEEAVVEEPQELAQGPEQEQPEEEEEEEEAETRRKRIAERIAKMGAINPFAPPPISRGSVSDEAEVTSPPASIRSAPARRSSVDSVGSVKSGVLAKRASIGSVASPPPARRSSVDSVSSSVGPAVPARRGSVDSVKEVESGPVKGAVVGGIPEQDEREEAAAVDESVPEVQEEGSNDALAASMILQRPPPTDIEREAHETIPVPAPPVDRTTRPPIPVSDVPSQTQTQIGTSASVHQRGSSGYVTRPAQIDDERDRRLIEQTTVVEPSRVSPPPLPISPRTAAFVPGSLSRRFTAHDEDDDDDDDEEEEEEPRPLPVPHRTSSMLSPRPALKREPNVGEEDRQDDQQDQVKHVPPPPTRQVPLPPPSASPVQAELAAGPPLPIGADSTPSPHLAVVAHKEESEPEREKVQVREQEQAPEPGSAHSDAPLVIPPPAADRRLSKGSHATRDGPLPHPMSFRQSQPQVEARRQEIMDDEEGDPIDPSIYVPKRSPGHISQVMVPEPPPPPPGPTQEEGGKTQEVVDPNATDMEAAKRRTIAERMAKLGGIKFGAAPPVPVVKLPSSSSLSAEEASEAERNEERKEEDVCEVQSGGGEKEEKKEVDEEEEEERARKERIAVKLAGMGGMRIGMMPSTMGFPPRPPQRPLPPTQVREEAKGPPTRPPPPLHSQEAEWERGSASNSEDGVKVEMEESDIEEVNHEDARIDDEDAEVVAPPLPPPRVHPPLSPTLRTRPPVPSTASIRRGNTLGRRDSGASATTTQTASTSPQRARGNSDFVMVEEPLGVGEDEEQAQTQEQEQGDVPPPPPVRPPQRRLTREAPSHPPPQHSMSDSISSQWELPSVPSGSFGLGTHGLTSDLSMSWTETEDLAATMVHPPPPPPPGTEFTSTTLQNLSPEELTAIWKRVGVQICEAATLLYEKSKKTVVGDGTYAGFVNAALSEVPNAAKPSGLGGAQGWGYLVYAQTGSAVQKRLSEIMTGDVVEFVDVRFKGHKKLQPYSQHVGAAGEPLVGVVSEVEHKKSKVKLLQANQHVGQQTVESVSYRLEDLKSGTVKVYRILEA